MTGLRGGGFWYQEDVPSPGKPTSVCIRIRSCPSSTWISGRDSALSSRECSLERLLLSSEESCSSMALL